MKTNGTVNIVTPYELVREIRKIDQNPAIATNVEVKVVAHPLLELHSLDGGSTEDHTVALNVGNATRDTDITFHFQAKKAKRSSKHSVRHQHLPFQLQILYTRLDGSKCLRVITKSMRVTTSREKHERTCDASVTALATVHRCAALAQQKVRCSSQSIFETQNLGLTQSRTSRLHCTAFIARSAC